MNLKYCSVKTLKRIIENNGLGEYSRKKGAKKDTQTDYYALFGEEEIKALLNSKLGKVSKANNAKAIKQYDDLSHELDKRLATWRKCAEMLNKDISRFSRFMDKDISISSLELINSIENQIMASSAPF